MKRFIVNSLAATFLVVGTLSAATINQRRENQKDRIAQGVRSGQLTAHETASLENKEARLNHQIRNDREDHNGHLTGRQHAQVNREQNRLSRDIYRDKHNQYRQ
jgi:hypothetical protein